MSAARLETPPSSCELPLHSSAVPFAGAGVYVARVVRGLTDSVRTPSASATA